MSGILTDCKKEPLVRIVQEKTRKWLYVVLLGIIVLSGGTGAASGAPKPSEPVRLAIIPGEGERAPEEELVATMEVALSEMEGVTLLERAQMRRVLTEQKISARIWSRRFADG